MSNRFKYTPLVLLVLIAAPLFAQTVTLKEAYIPLPGGGKAIYGSAGTQTYYQRQDGLKNIRITTTPSKTIGSSVGVSPFGEEYDDDLPNGLIDMQFQGMGQESATAGGVAAGYGGVYVTPNRTYSAIQGRWLSPDPIPGDNAYMYVHNAPILRSDASGLQDGGGDDGGDCDDGCISYDGGGDGGFDYSDPGIDFGDFGFSGDVGAPGFYGISQGLYSPGGGRLYPSLVTPDAVIILVYRTPIHGLNDLLYNLPGGLANSPIVMVKGAVQQWGLMETGTPKQLWKELTYRPSWLGPAVAANNGTLFAGVIPPGTLRQLADNAARNGQYGPKTTPPPATRPTLDPNQQPQMNPKEPWWIRLWGLFPGGDGSFTEIPLVIMPAAQSCAILGNCPDMPYQGPI